MGKGSQLSQLKSALSQAGITPQRGKKRKRSNALDPDKEKKASKLSGIHQKLNPFDVKVTKLKHDVGGRKLKGVTGRPARSKEAGLAQRKNTLLKEYEEKGRSGGIVDRRFGENDPAMTPEERMLERFIKERQRASKGAAFNLEDEDELTHYGQSLSKLDDFGDISLGLDDDEEERGQIDGEVVRKTHFGGFDDEDEEDDEKDDKPARKRSKAEVMSEVMAKSKEHKYLRQMERERGENIRHELDQEFDSLRSLLYPTDPSAVGSVPPAGHGPDKKKFGELASLTEATDDYDQHVRELAFDKRARPKDRTKTEEELALEEKVALEKAERERQRRMLGEEDDDAEENRKTKGRRKRERGADDLEDDFYEESAEWNGLGPGLGGESEADKGDHSSESGGSAIGDAVEEEDSGSEDESDVDDRDDASGSGSEHEDLVSTARVRDRKPKPKTTNKELPYTFECPTSHQEFLDMVEDVEDKDVPTVVQRIRTLYNPKLAPDNKFKLQTLTSVLIDHILYITSPPSPRIGLLSSLLPHLFALTRSYPVQAAESFVEKLALMHKNLKHGLSQDPLDADARTWPGIAELLFFRVIGGIWPTSDLNHAVVSPTRVLIGAYLALCRVRSLRDIASGLFLCTLFLQFEELSKRLVPEAVNFLSNAILHLAPHGFKDINSLPGSFPSPDFMSDSCRTLSLNVTKSHDLTVNKPEFVTVLSKLDHDEQTKVDLLGLSFHLLGRYAEMYKSLEGFVELFEPPGAILQKVRIKKLPENLQVHAKASLEVINKLLKFSREGRKPLLLQSHKPIPIPSYIPKFEVNSSSYLRHRDPDHERNEATKLRRQVKQEKKGAIRELRKDARFLAAVQQKKQAQKDLEYNTRMKRVLGSIESERAEEKAMEREKSKMKKRAGRK